MDEIETAKHHLLQLLAPITSGPEMESVDSRLRQIFGPEASGNPEGLTLDDCLGDRKACLLCITPRSGSTYLGSLMRSTGRLGLAAESLNWSGGAQAATGTFRELNGCDPMEPIARKHGLNSLRDYLRHIIDR